MRYAAPPLGDLRWRAPVEPKRTDTVEKANQFGPICLRAGAGAPFPGQDEDCLYVNVCAPANATEKSKLPVWVFIGGGGKSLELRCLDLGRREEIHVADFFSKVTMPSPTLIGTEARLLRSLATTSSC